MSIVLASPAKVNLFFHVLWAREDGFHEIRSCYQAVDLCDELEVRISHEDHLSSDGWSMPMGEDNLIMRALQRFRSSTDCSLRFSIHVKKRIPLQAGLGGGSSNAATALWAFSALSGQHLSRERLMELSRPLGSDVPFFFSSGSALAEGKGEILTDIDMPLPSAFWLAKPQEGLSTAEVYQKCIPGGLRKDQLFSNDLEKAAFSLLPSLAQTKASLLQWGFTNVVMTGSGTALLAWDGDRKFSQEEVTKAFPSLWWARVAPFQRKSMTWYEHRTGSWSA